MDAAQSISSRRIRVRGQVQGVGFRPHVWRLAREGGLSGHVLNDAEGVLIEASGEPAHLDAFLARLRAEAPPLSRIDALEVALVEGEPFAGAFEIVQSREGAVATGVTPDAATCPDCLAEVLDPADRRHGYVFANCTHCGPRFSIIEAIPYDRASTSMRVFVLCPDCRREYEDPADRRFHAQPNACPVCGPRLSLRNLAGPLPGGPIEKTARVIREGGIAAIKGIGGYHLACDALNEVAVAELRRRKLRADKPLALMARNLDGISRFAAVSEAEAAMLASPAAPIVLLRAAGAPLAPSVAPGQDHVGFMLPYTPLHHLLMRRIDGPVVLTSGNLSDAPQTTDNADALERLAGVADVWLAHDRRIVNRIDDSVLRLDRAGPTVLRRARGMAPEPLRLGEPFQNAPRVLAMGGELKSTFCLLKGREAVISQHMGDLEDAAVLADYRRNLDLYRALYRFEPEIIAVDAHPDYLSTQWGARLAEETGARLVKVQHHHAHLAACLAEHGEARGLGVVLDGLGYGEDGTVWGGEFLLGDLKGFERLAHLPAVALPGGAQAMREPWRNALAHLRAALGPGWRGAVEGTGFGALLATKPVATLEQMIDRGLNAPLASSAGRLFDAAAALLGFSAERQGYEGHAAMEMEAAARPFLADEAGYEFAIDDLAPLWRTMLGDLTSGAEPGPMAARFHLGLIDAVARAATALAAAHGVDCVALSGGVMQNKILLEGLHARLAKAGLRPLSHSRVPANDGGLALGQAVIAASIAALA